MQMKSSRLRAGLAAGALALVPTLGACGFDYATDAIYTPAEGVNERQGDIDVLNAMIVAEEDGSGTFIATFVHNERTETATFEGIAGEVRTDDEVSMTIPPSDRGHLNLAEEEPIVVTGDFEVGYFVPVELTFGNGQVTEFQVPIIPDSGAYEGLDASGSSGGTTPTSDPSPTSSPSPTDEADGN